MKRLIAVVLTGVLALMLVSCGEDKKAEIEPTAPPPEVTSLPTEEPVVTVYPQVNIESEEAYISSMKEIISYIETTNGDLKSELLKNIAESPAKLKETAEIYADCASDMDSDKIKDYVPQSYVDSHNGIVKAINAYSQLCDEAAASISASDAVGATKYIAVMQQNLQSADELWNTASSVFK